MFDLLSFSNRSDIKAWALKYPVLARLTCLLILLVFPLLVPGVILMTKAAKSFGKRLDNFFANADTQDYLRGLEEIPGIPGNTSTPWLKQCQTLN